MMRITTMLKRGTIVEVKLQNGVIEHLTSAFFVQVAPPNLHRPHGLHKNAGIRCSMTQFSYFTSTYYTIRECIMITLIRRYRLNRISINKNANNSYG